ncbi:16S rRNA (uracil(1498)-N(3))-methyltransferase [Granulicoccus phenolivorans]|uniref:16S rRNA (uracil(1498)-N(3))-methyltransferase n=1 Tax=Granulicoccus phenolivorans TaxID=266854 RepID=UPI00041CADAD|nr:16S rRNA (uracil(1498)-N(3))-methyltransferase [Granulicoccus phenolivorans]
MTRPLFLTELPEPLPAVGQAVPLRGDEGRHAAVVRRIEPGEVVDLADGAGRAVTGPVTEVTKQGITIEVAEVRVAAAPAPEVWVAQALAKGDRGELAVEMLTEVGVAGVYAWQANRSIVKWSGDRAAKALGKWANTVREATKQSRRLWIPQVRGPLTTKQLVAEFAGFDAVYVLHEDATDPLSAAEPGQRVLLLVGPEGGIGDDELGLLTAAGARTAVISDGVLRTSTAGVVAVGQLRRPD